MTNKHKLISFFLVLILCLPCVVSASEESSWNFASATNFEIEGQDSVQFSNGSAKVIPNGIALDREYAWYDTHFDNDTAYTVAWGGEADPEGNYYLAGSTAASSVSDRYAFIVKLDSSFNEIWYKQYFATKSSNSSENGFDGIRLDSGGNLVVSAFYYDDPTLKNAYIKIAKISPSDGSIIWQVDRARGNNWIDTWDDGANGPALDSNDNLYVVSAVGTNNNGGSGPLEIYKLDTNGNIIWDIEDDTVVGRTSPTTYPYYEDVWQMVVDSEDSLYISATIISGLGSTNGGLNYGLIKISSDGVFQWRKIKDMYDRWDAPRGLSIDSDDVVYQNGNADSGCGIRKVAADGTVLVDKKIEAYLPSFVYAWNSAFNVFDQYFLTVTRSDLDDIAMVVLDQDLGKLYSTTFTISEADGNIWGHNVATKFGKYGSPVSFIAYVGNAEHGSTYTPVIIKSSYSYPDQDDTDKISFKNKTPVAYNNLRSFKVNYGNTNQGDPLFQISNNGQDWYYFNGSGWVAVGDSGGNNTEAEVNANISKFSDQSGAGDFYFKMFYDTGGSQQMDVSSISLGYNGSVAASVTVSATASSADSSNSSSLTILPVTGISRGGMILDRIIVFIKSLF